MKKITLILLAILTVPISANAAEFRTGEQVSVSAGEVINDDLYAGGGSISISGVSNGDVIVGGGTILITGPVRQDVVAGGGTVNILTDIEDDIRVGGGNILIQGKVGGDVFAGGGQIQISGSGVGGDIFIAGGLVRIESPISGDVKIGGGEVYINSPIAGNVSIDAEKITLGSSAIISGDFSYKSANKAHMENGSQVLGKTDFRKKENNRAEFLVGVATFGTILKFLMILLGSLLVMYAFPRYTRDLVSFSYSNPLRNIGIGFLFLISVPIAAIILLVSMIGIPIGVLGILGYLAILIWSMFIAPILLGSLLRKWYRKDELYIVSTKSIIVGVVVYVLIGIIPLIGGIIKFGFMIFALGSSAVTKWEMVKKFR